MRKGRGGKGKFNFPRGDGVFTEKGLGVSTTIEERERGITYAARGGGSALQIGRPDARWRSFFSKGKRKKKKGKAFPLGKKGEKSFFFQT